MGFFQRKSSLLASLGTEECSIQLIIPVSWTAALQKLWLMLAACSTKLQNSCTLSDEVMKMAKYTKGLRLGGGMRACVRACGCRCRFVCMCVHAHACVGVYVCVPHAV